MYFELVPEVAGGWGQETVVDRSVHPPRILKLEYRFEDWLGDDLLATSPCYVVTERLASALEIAGLTGFSLADVVITTSELFDRIHRDLKLPRTLPQFRWLKVHGAAGRDDFGLLDGYRLVVSDHALEVLNGYNLHHAEIRALKQPNS
jgi:hypothetical protein